MNFFWIFFFVIPLTVYIQSTELYRSQFSCYIFLLATGVKCPAWQNSCFCFHYFSDKIRHCGSCELSARQIIHLICQALFSLEKTLPLRISLLWKKKLPLRISLKGLFVNGSKVWCLDVLYILGHIQWARSSKRCETCILITVWSKSAVTYPIDPQVGRAKF